MVEDSLPFCEPLLLLRQFIHVLQLFVNLSHHAFAFFLRDLLFPVTSILHLAIGFHVYEGELIDLIGYWVTNKMIAPGFSALRI